MKRINEKTLESLEIKMHGLSKKKKKRHSDVQEFNFQKKKMLASFEKTPCYSEK